jgi:SMC interacting uncharacterized protein involved in chromosome segregation
MTLADIIKTIQEDWAILVFVFGLGGAWWQGKQWFSGVTEGLNKAISQHDNQTNILEHIQMKTDILEERSDKIESTVNEIHNKLHEQEVKLAILETVTEVKRQRSTK